MHVSSFNFGVVFLAWCIWRTIIVCISIQILTWDKDSVIWGNYSSIYRYQHTVPVCNFHLQFSISIMAVNFVKIIATSLSHNILEFFEFSALEVMLYLLTISPHRLSRSTLVLIIHSWIPESLIYFGKDFHMKQL